MENAIRASLSSAHGLASLSLQNHIYGCYFLLEDIVQNNVVRTGTQITRNNASFDLITNFGEIGLRYGFAMDAQLVLRPSPEYQEAWIHAFTTTKTLEEVDALEDSVNRIIYSTVPPEEGFFGSTVESGALPPVWVDKALALLLPKVEAPSVVPVEAPMVTPSVAPMVTPVEAVPVAPVEAVPSVAPSVAQAAPSVAPSVVPWKHHDNPKRLFAATRRKKLIVPKKLLSTTRRKNSA